MFSFEQKANYVAVFESWFWDIPDDAWATGFLTKCMSLQLKHVKAVERSEIGPPSAASHIH